MSMSYGLFTYIFQGILFFLNNSALMGLTKKGNNCKNISALKNEEGMKYFHACEILNFKHLIFPSTINLNLCCFVVRYRYDLSGHHTSKLVFFNICS